MGRKRRIAIILIFLTSMLVSLGQVFWKFGANELPLLTDAFIPVLIGFIFYGSGSVLFIWSLKYLDLSYAYPIIALSYVWVCLLSPVFFNDYMTFLKWIGVFSIIFGISLIGLGGNKYD